MLVSGDQSRDEESMFSKLDQTLIHMQRSTANQDTASRQNAPTTQVGSSGGHEDTELLQLGEFVLFLNDYGPTLRIGQWEQQRAANMAVPNPQPNHQTGKVNAIPLPRYDRYEWFHVLIAMMFCIHITNSHNPHSQGSERPYRICIGHLLRLRLFHSHNVLHYHVCDPLPFPYPDRGLSRTLW